MPQPLSRVKPDANILIAGAGARLLSEQPQLAILVSEAIGSWSNVEGFLLLVFVRLFGGESTLATRMYLAVETHSAKTKLLEEAVKSVPEEKIRSLIVAVIKISKTNQKLRDKLAHHIWGISPDLPDALLLADPKTLVTGSTDRESIYVYRANDLHNIIAANDRLCGYGLRLMSIVDGDDRDDRLYAQLCNEPEVAEKLRHPD